MHRRAGISKIHVSKPRSEPGESEDRSRGKPGQQLAVTAVYLGLNKIVRIFCKHFFVFLEH